MEFVYEALVLGFLTNGGKRFCCPQFAMKTEDGSGEWRCPDFVVLDFEAPQRVTTAYDMKPFANKVAELYSSGREKLRNQLAGTLAPLDIKTWPVCIQLFVRQDRKDELNKLLKVRNVTEFDIATLEETLQRWRPNYGERKPEQRAAAQDS